MPHEFAFANPKQGMPVKADQDEVSMEKNKIVLLLDNFLRRGSTRQAYLLAREIRDARRLNVEVWALSAGECESDFSKAGIPTRILNFRNPGCPIRFVQRLFWVTRLIRLALQLSGYGIRVLLPFDSRPNVLAGMTYRFARIPLCVWAERSVYRIGGVRRALRRYSRFTANSTEGIDFLVRELGVPRGKIRFIPNAVEKPEERRAADWRAGLGIRSNQLLVVQIADIYEPRDPATLLRAWHIVQESWDGENKPVLVLAGALGGPYSECLRLVRQMQLDATVKFVGRIHNVSALIKVCDLAVHSSRAEAMPNGILECMAFGKAVVATDLLGIRDGLGEASAHVLVRPGDAEDLARALLKILRDTNMRTALGEANRLRAAEEFSVQAVTDAYLDLIGGSLPNSAPAGSVSANLMQTQTAGSRSGNFVR